LMCPVLHKRRCGRGNRTDVETRHWENKQRGDEKKRQGNCLAARALGGRALIFNS
jgi:hypothetical protein